VSGQTELGDVSYSSGPSFFACYAFAVGVSAMDPQESGESDGPRPTGAFLGGKSDGDG
jgi:hypothetical protein